MAATRGLAEAIRRERFVEYIFRKFPGRAKLIEAHGGLSRSVTPRYDRVPEDTVLIFLSNFGQCMDIQFGRRLANEYFTSKKGLVKFFRGEAGFARVHHGEIASRTFLPGEEYPNAGLLFYDQRFTNYGYVWKLPLKYTRAELSSEMLVERRAVTGANVYNAIPRGPRSDTTLQQVINRLGPGVYIINACLVPTNQGNLPVGKIPFNLPRGHFARRLGVPRTRNARAYAKTIYGRKPVRPGTPAVTSMFVKSRSARRRVPHVTVQEILTRLGRPGANINLDNWFPRMRPNVNKARLKAIQRIIKNPTNMLSKFNNNQRARWNSLSWNLKGPFVASWLNRTGYVFQASTKNKNYWYNGNTGREIAPPPLNALREVNWNNKVTNIFNSKFTDPILTRRSNITWSSYVFK